MALFREHVSFGAIVAMLGVVLAYHYALVTDWRLLAALFCATVIGSFLPDLDSDSSVPLRMVLSLLTVVAAGAAFYVVLVMPPEDVLWRFGAPVLAGGFVWFVIGGIVKKLTHHRGMFHSLPAAAIAGLSSYLVVHALIEHESAPLVIGLAVAAGYLAHLVLDEIHSGVNIDGSLFEAKRSLGSALKLISSERVATVFSYALLTVLAYSALHHV